MIYYLRKNYTGFSRLSIMIVKSKDTNVIRDSFLIDISDFSNNVLYIKFNEKIFIEEFIHITETAKNKYQEINKKQKREFISALLSSILG